MVALHPDQLQAQQAVVLRRGAVEGGAAVFQGQALQVQAGAAQHFQQTVVAIGRLRRVDAADDRLRAAGAAEAQMVADIQVSIEVGVFVVANPRLAELGEQTQHITPGWQQDKVGAGFAVRRTHRVA